MARHGVPVCVTIGLLLWAAPADAQRRFACSEAAAECVDPSDASTCEELPDLERRDPGQVIVDPSRAWSSR
jgi:hypothetical protein